MDVRSIDAIVAMVSAGLGVSIVPRPRKPLLEAYRVREMPLGKTAPSRRVALARRRADLDSRNIGAVFSAFAAAYGED